MYFTKGGAVQLLKDPKKTVKCSINLMFGIPKKKPHQLLDDLQILSLINNKLMMYVCYLYITIFVWSNQRLYTSVHICLEYSTTLPLFICTIGIYYSIVTCMYCMKISCFFSVCLGATYIS